ncbi:hypothetical protein ABEB36_015388 [Hypothenemus hampei]|uniref:Uncharacterized protein n=1 Tax=Hypothenemus hampei TaxID=57062 RepID=A0ABD1E0Z8_HYPHA
MFKQYVVVLLLAANVWAQDFDYAPRPAPTRIQPGYSGPSNAPKPTPVAIIKQIDRHNEDGSYTYGYESADGSFKIETKLPTGEVKGKYGYVDDVGKVRVIEYGATKHGFAPAGEGITVPPPTLVDETTDKNGNLLPEFSADYDQINEPPARAQPPITRPRPIATSNYEFSAPRPVPRPAPVEYSPPQSFQPAPRTQQPASTFSFDFPSSPASGREQQSFSARPTPPRPAAFANAAPAPVEQDVTVGFPNARPSPRLTSTFDLPPSRPAPPTQSFAPAPQYRPTPQLNGRQSGGSILDQLSKDYALPQGNSAPLHDISFGYF